MQLRRYNPVKQSVLLHMSLGLIPLVPPPSIPLRLWVILTLAPLQLLPRPYGSRVLSQHDHRYDTPEHSLVVCAVVNRFADNTCDGNVRVGT